MRVLFPFSLPQLQASIHSLTLSGPTISGHRTDLETLRASTIALRRLLSYEGGPPIDEVLAAGVLPRLLAMMGSAPEECKARRARGGSGSEEVGPGWLCFEAAWAVTNLCSGNSEQVCVLPS